MSRAPSLVTCADGPYERWTFDRGQAYAAPGLDRTSDSLTCLFETSEHVAVGDLPKRCVTPGGTFHLPVLWSGQGFEARHIPAVFKNSKDVPADTSRFATFSADVAHVQTSAFGTTAPVQAHMNYPVREATVFEGWTDSPAPQHSNSPDEIVIVAIIDDGIPFAHRQFLNSSGTGTRIDYCWSQSATAQGHPMLFGREFDRNTIDALYRDHQRDEGAIYQAAGLAQGEESRVRNPLDLRNSHGGHVLDSLAGQLPGTAEARQDRVHIIAVDLPAMISSDTSGFGKDVFVLSALHYIFDRADKIAAAYAKPGARVPLVVNLSYGHSGGAHDGTGLIEQAFDDMIVARRRQHPTAVVLPSGNMFLQSIHAVVTDQHFEKTDDPVELDWFVPPNDRTSSFVEIWLPDGLSPRDVQITLVPPRLGQVSATAMEFPDKAHSPIILDGHTIGQLTTEQSMSGRWRHVIALAPTDVPVDLEPAPSGRWTVRLTKVIKGPLPAYTTDANGQVQAGCIQLWIQRDEDFGNSGSGARQSYFIDPDNALYADDGRLAERDSAGALVRRFGTLSGMATGQHVLRVGGYDESTLRAARYSCAGSLRAQVGQAQDKLQVGAQVQLSAVSERSFVRPGIVGVGTRSGTYFAASGTSSAAPQVARALVDAFLDTPPGKLGKVKDYLGQLDLKTGTEDPTGPDRLGQFIVRQPRMVGAEDEQSYIDKLVLGRI